VATWSCWIFLRRTETTTAPIVADPINAEQQTSLGNSFRALHKRFHASARFGLKDATPDIGRRPHAAVRVDRPDIGDAVVRLLAACGVFRIRDQLCAGSIHFRDFSFVEVRSRTPGPPPFSSMNSTPAASNARRTARSFAAVMEVSLSVSSARRIVLAPREEAVANSAALHLRSALAALICEPKSFPFMLTFNLCGIN